MFSVIKQGILFHLRQRKWIIFNALFPIFLMTLLGAMLSSSSNSNINISDIRICYLETEENKHMIKNIREDVFSNKIEMDSVSSMEEGKERVKKEREIFLYPIDNKIEVYFSEKLADKGGIVLSYLDSFSEINTTIKEMYRIDSNKAIKLLDNDDIYNDKINIEFLDKEKGPNSYQYYGVVELTMMMFYTTLFPLGLLGSDRRRLLKERIVLTGVSDFKYFLARILSSFVVSILIILPGFLFSNFVMESNWGEYPLLTFSYVIAMTLMMVTLGTVVGYAIKQRDKAVMVLQGIIIPVLSFLGGAFISLPLEMSGVFNVITSISPLRWLNKGIFEVAYYGDYYSVNISLLISICVTAILLGTLYVVLRRERKI